MSFQGEQWANSSDAKISFTSAKYLVKYAGYWTQGVKYPLGYYAHSRGYFTTFIQCPLCNLKATWVVPLQFSWSLKTSLLPLESSLECSSEQTRVLISIKAAHVITLPSQIFRCPNYTSSSSHAILIYQPPITNKFIFTYSLSTLS